MVSRTDLVQPARLANTTNGKEAALSLVDAVQTREEQQA